VVDLPLSTVVSARLTTAICAKMTTKATEETGVKVTAFLRMGTVGQKAVLVVVITTLIRVSSVAAVVTIAMETVIG